MCRPNSFVGLLRVFNLAAVYSQGNKFLSEFFLDDTRNLSLSRLCNIGGVRTHIGDKPRFIKLLCYPHRSSRGETEASRGGLLERRGDEGGLGRASDTCFGYIGYSPLSTFSVF